MGVPNLTLSVKWLSRYMLHVPSVGRQTGIAPALCDDGRVGGVAACGGVTGVTPRQFGDESARRGVTIKRPVTPVGGHRVT